MLVLDLCESPKHTDDISVVETTAIGFVSGPVSLITSDL